MSIAKAISSASMSNHATANSPTTDIYLRVFISDSGSTVVQVTETEPLSEVLVAVCAKRGLSPSDLKLAIVYKDGTEDANVDGGRWIGEFKPIDFLKVVEKETGKFTKQAILSQSIGNLNIVGSEQRLEAPPIPKSKSIKEKVGVFPKAFSAFSASASNLMNDGGAKLLAGRGTFKKGSTDFLKGEADAGNGTSRQSTKQISTTQTADSDIVSRHDSLASLDSCLVENPISMVSMQTSMTPSTYEKLERSDSASKPGFLSTEGVVLKKLTRSNRSRANTEGIQEINPKKASEQITASDKPDKQYATLIITLPNFRSITIRAPNDLPLDAILNYVCERHNFEFELHTFQRNDTTDTVVEMDRTLAYIASELKVTELFMVPEEKVYRSTYLSEDGVDVMILQSIQGRQQVMAGSPHKLIARLTDSEFKDDEAFIETFLLTFRYYMPATDFFRHLVLIYNCVPPENASPEDLEYFTIMKLPTQACVANILQKWAANHWHDFALHNELKTQLELFGEEFLYNDDLSIRIQSGVLKELIAQQTEKYEEMYSYYKTVEQRSKILESMILELTPEVLSLQICIHDFKLFRNIHPIEFLHQIWGSDRENTPYLNFFIDRFDKESYWVATEVVMQKDIKKRVNVLKNFILTTKACQEANNFFSLFSMMSGLSLSPVSRLKKTWEALPDKAKQVYAELEKIIDPSRNMKNYRDLLAKASKPIVPFLPIYLKDLTFMNDGNAKMIEGMINFEKLRMMGNRVKDIVSLVAVEYKEPAQPHIQNYVAKPPVEKNMAKLKEMSIECEK